MLQITIKIANYRKLTSYNIYNTTANISVELLFINVNGDMQ